MEHALFKKLQIKSNYSVSVINGPENCTAIFGTYPDDISISFEAIANANGYLLFATTKAQLGTALDLILNSITDKTVIWILYPKAKAAIATDLNLMHSWDGLTNLGLAPAAAAAVNETWTALRIKTIRSQKKSGLGNTQLKESPYAAYIDVVNKTVKLPIDVAEMLAQHPAALKYFNQLAYSHQKEYVLWILTAKQEKTRATRLVKMLTMLLEEKKNPTAK